MREGNQTHGVAVAREEESEAHDGCAGECDEFDAPEACNERIDKDPRQVFGWSSKSIKMAP